MSEHTPGPWEWWTSNSWKRLKREAGPITQRVLEPYVCRDGQADVAISEADMDLIAAAPDLLEAAQLLVKCKDVKDRLDRWEAGSTQEMAAMLEWYDANKPKAWQAMRDAIKKATMSDPPQPLTELCDGQYCCRAKGHEGECDDIPF